MTSSPSTSPLPRGTCVDRIVRHCPQSRRLLCLPSRRHGMAKASATCAAARPGSRTPHHCRPPSRRPWNGPRRTTAARATILAARPRRQRGDRHHLRAARVIGRLVARLARRPLESPRCPPTNRELSDNAKPASDVASARLRARCPPPWAGRPCPEADGPGTEAGAGSTPTRASEERVGADHAGVGRARVPPRRAADEGGSRDRPSERLHAWWAHRRRAGFAVFGETERSAGQLSDGAR